MARQHKLSWTQEVSFSLSKSRIEYLLHSWTCAMSDASWSLAHFYRWFMEWPPHDRNIKAIFQSASEETWGDFPEEGILKLTFIG